MKYKSFNTNKQKFRKLNERIDKNESDLKNASRITIDFNSINFNKRIHTIPLITDKLFDSSTDFIKEFFLANFPEEYINMIQPTATFYISDGLTIKSSDPVKTGDIIISNNEFKYWFNRIDQTHFNLKIFYDINIREVLVTESGFITFPVDTFFSISLTLLNTRIYENINQNFE